MPYHSVWMENGENEIIRCPSPPRYAKARYTRATNPSMRKPKEIIRKPWSLFGGSDFPGGEIVQKAQIADRYMSVHQSAPDHPILVESGVSFTIRIPINKRDAARRATCESVFQIGSPLSRRDPRAKGMDIPTMKRNAGNTRSTN